MSGITYQPSLTWANIQNKPTTFIPSLHGHDAGEITSGIINAARIPSQLPATAFVLNNVVVSNVLYASGQLQLYDNAGGAGIASIGFHRAGHDAAALYWNGKFRTRRHTGEDFELAEVASGTWVPTVSGSGGGAATFFARSGNWRRVGNIVFCDFSF